jgi:hypothetical protein
VAKLASQGVRDHVFHRIGRPLSVVLARGPGRKLNDRREAFINRLAESLETLWERVENLIPPTSWSTTPCLSTRS